jgi:hypothetical protein
MRVEAPNAALTDLAVDRLAAETSRRCGRRVI